MNLLRYESQLVLFSPKLSRTDLLELKPPCNTDKFFNINVWRNHTFESLIPLIEPYTSFGKWHANFRIEAYDDTLMFTNWQHSDVELLWLDSSRFLLDTNFKDWLDWLVSRLRVLRTISNAPIVLATWTIDEEQSDKLQEEIDQFPAVYFSNIKKICADSSIELLDQRTAKMAGTPVSNSAQLILARELACHWLPAVLFPPIKAVAVDLDHTLHCGVLGEDGINGVQLTQMHLELQQFIKSLQQRGIFIALVSRNERVDVEALFAQREDYPLRWNDFSVTEISWGDKSNAIESIAQVLRIATDSILFVDDNLGELTNVTMQFPKIHTVYASPDAQLTQRAIEYFPGLWRWKLEVDDTKRVQDMKANSERDALLTMLTDMSAYFISLHMTLIFRYNPSHDQLSRLADLCNKTNQFNLAVRRFNQAEIAERLVRSDACVVSIQVKDRLSDSGVIAVIVAERDGKKLVIEELCISCRALGRQLEDTLILTAIRDMPLFIGCHEIAFRVQHSLRNQPALDWLARLSASKNRPEPGLYTISAERFSNFEPAYGVTLIKE